MHNIDSEPDALLGAVLAIEGISDARAVIHGPAGCRKNIVCHSRRSYARPCKMEDSKEWPSFFDLSDRIPYTDMSPDDYISGGCGKIAQTLSRMISATDDMIVVVDTPSTSLNGDSISRPIHVKGYENRIIRIDDIPLSEPFCRGFDHALTRILRDLNPIKKRTKDRAVNILGINIWHKDWKHALSELRSILELMGLEVLSSPGAGSSVEDLMNSVEASLNIVVAPEYCEKLRHLYSERYGIQCVMSEMPIGFSNIHTWIDDIAEKLQISPEKAKDAIRAAEKDTFLLLDSSRPSLPLRGSTFAIEGDVSVVSPMVEWLHSYLSLIPNSVIIRRGAHDHQIDDLKNILSKMECSDALYAKRTYSDLVFSDGITANLSLLKGECRKAVSISCPQPRTDFVSSPVIGCEGVLYILDKIVNDWH